jgi:hypothetical protein
LGGLFERNVNTKGILTIFVVTIFVASCTSAPTQIHTPIATPTSAPEALDHDQISGTYRFERADGGSCAIQAVLVPTTPIDKIDLELLCVRGALSYNSGYAVAQLLFMHETAVYSPNTDCSIVFDFGNDKITVKQIGKDFDCGFGQAVYADGVYSLVDGELPVIGCLHQDNPC